MGQDCRHSRTEVSLNTGGGAYRRTERQIKYLGAPTANFPNPPSHGHPVKIIHRPDLVKFLYESLPETAKSRVLLGKQVVDIAVSEDGVEVSCADGSTVRGSIVIGADGVRSRVRLLMRALVAGVRPDDLSPDQRDPYVATYRQYCAAIPSLPGIPAYSRYDGTGDGLTTQLINSRGIGWYSVYEKLADGPTARYTRYTEADKRAIVEKYGHLYVAPGGGCATSTPGAAARPRSSTSRRASWTAGPSAASCSWATPSASSSPTPASATTAA